MSTKIRPNTDISLGHRIRTIRKEKSLTLASFAGMIGISHGSLSDIENGKTKPSADTLASICRHTDINIGWILTGEGQAYTNEGIGGANTVREAQAAWQSQNVVDGSGAPIDMDFLKDVIEVVERVLSKHGLMLEPPDKAEAITILYEMYQDTGKKPEERTAERILRLAA